MQSEVTSSETRAGNCLCGAVSYQVRGNPLRIGLCHCTDCRQSSGSAYATFAIWPRASFSSEGMVSSYSGRSFCPRCGSRLFNLNKDEVEIQIGTLVDAPTDLQPTYELWIKRREHWLHPLPGTRQFSEDAISEK
ncbi:GFA family protein [Rhizobium sp. BK376]|uniref:GFA family protein n=1 Tax=Rhizobium sp. BK376 TaxID=2512149 RepID=UPI001050D1DF|nr:GFA family protein [Rhizobium sp. BK376]TCR85378.1 hypothetical protein EV561_107150 [Rhizobium sp. BK376]